MYVALWYKHGRPVHGRAWNNGGVIECSFPYKKAELTGIKDLGGQIQILQYKGDHNSLGFWYEWIKYKDRFEKAEERQMLKCGDSLPILWKDRKEGAILGYLDNSTEFALFSHDGITELLQGPALDNMWIIVRNIKGGPPSCECKNCYRPPPPPPPAPESDADKAGGAGGAGGTGVGTEAGAGGAAGAGAPLPPRVMIDEWMDIRAGDPWPERKLMKALNKTLDTIPGENPDQYVALWYQQGEPIMGRVWNDNGKVAAAFGWFDKEYRDKVGSLQVLVELADYVRGFDYKWVPFSECGHFGEKEWTPVYVDYPKGIISPAVMTWEGKQILGKADIRNEKVSSAFNGKENCIIGPEAQAQMVLCRKPRPGYKFD
uniref:MFP2c n=1 Tax=Ascaris suum TaxID=6253 RepID=Q5MAJ6_ASCSU|nr:MFP2c [Ascaris suum]